MYGVSEKSIISPLKIDSFYKFTYEAVMVTLVVEVLTAIILLILEKNILWMIKTKTKNIACEVIKCIKL